MSEKCPGADTTRHAMFDGFRGTPARQRPAGSPRKGRPARFAVASVVRAGAGVPNDLMLVAG
jgi:hypothetical protein